MTECVKLLFGEERNKRMVFMGRFTSCHLESEMLRTGPLTYRMSQRTRRWEVGIDECKFAEWKKNGDGFK